MLQDGDGGVVEGTEEGEEELRTSWSTETLILVGTPLLDDIVRNYVIFMWEVI